MEQTGLPSLTQPTAAKSPLRIVNLSVDNFKRIVAVDLHPDGKSVVIGGRNGQGKSSLLDAIASALGGAKQAPEMPLRRGTYARRGAKWPPKTNRTPWPSAARKET